MEIVIVTVLATLAAATFANSLRDTGQAEPPNHNRYELAFVYRTKDGQTRDWSCTVFRPADEPIITDRTVLCTLIAAQESDYVDLVYGIITLSLVYPDGSKRQDILTTR